MSPNRPSIAAVAALLALASPAASQLGTRAAPGVIQPLEVIGGIADDRLRTLQLLGSATTDGYLLRSTSTLTAELPGDPNGLRWAIVSPELRTVRNSQIPYSLNDGAMWAGRGWTTQLTFGGRLAYHGLSLTIAPQILRAQNAEFPTIPSTAPGRSSLSPPWYGGPQSADVPYRPGRLPFTLFDLGQSTLSVRAGPLVLGGSTENQWWGPGVRNAIVMSSNAAGFPHLFARTTRPLSGRLGQLEAKWLVGGLTESLFFDYNPTNDIRSISALVVTYQPAVEPGLTVGLARSVYAAVDDAASVPGRFHQVLTHWRAAPLAGSAETDSAAAEQLLSLFGRWVFPESGFEAYFEWARVALPLSARDLLTMPHHSQGYTLGLQWVGRLGEDAAVRFQSEATYLEQSSTYRQRPTPLFYVSQSVVQGYTHRGQVIGAAIGPGASSQWAAVDYLGSDWQVGVFASRIRWDNDAYYRQPTGRSEVAHDVSMLGGVRGAVQVPGLRIAAEVAHMQRYNFLYQNLLQGFSGFGAVDPTNWTLSLSVTPRL